MSKTVYHPSLDGVTAEVEDGRVEDAVRAGWRKTKPAHYTGPTDFVRFTPIADVPRTAPAEAATAGEAGTTEKD